MNDTEEAYLNILLRFNNFTFFIEKVNNQFNITENKDTITNSFYFKYEFSKTFFKLKAITKVSPCIFIYKNIEKNLFFISDSFKIIYDKLIFLNIFKIENHNIIEFRKDNNLPGHYLYNEFIKNDPNNFINGLQVISDWALIEVRLDNFSVVPSNLKFGDIDISEAGFLIQNWLTKWLNILPSISNKVYLHLSGGINTRVNTFFFREVNTIGNFVTHSIKNEIENMIGLLVAHKLNKKEIGVDGIHISVTGYEVQTAFKKYEIINSETIKLFNRVKLIKYPQINALEPWHDEFLYRIKPSQLNLIRQSLLVLCAKDLLYIPLNSKINEEIYYVTCTNKIKKVIRSWYKTGLKEPINKNLPYWTYKNEVLN